MFYSSIIPRPLNNCLHYFTLKQGTIIIAILHLMIAGITLTIGILALTHAVDIREMVARDAEDAMDRGAFEDDNSMRLNMKRMKIAGCNAEDKVGYIWMHLMFGTSHLMGAVGLLCGVLANYRLLMVPWIYMSIMDLGLIIVVPLNNRPLLNLSKCMTGLIIAIAAIINIWSTYVVWSTYMSFNKRKGLIHEIHVVKKKPVQSVCECSSSTSTQTTQTKPYEV